MWSSRTVAGADADQKSHLVVHDQGQAQPLNRPEMTAPPTPLSPTMAQAPLVASGKALGDHEWCRMNMRTIKSAPRRAAPSLALGGIQDDHAKGRRVLSRLFRAGPKRWSSSCSFGRHDNGASEQGRGMPTQGRSIGGASKALVGEQQATPNNQNFAAPRENRPPCKSCTTRHVDPRSVRRQQAEGNSQCMGRQS
jgi:hypothetical protein